MGTRIEPDVQQQLEISEVLLRAALSIGGMGAWEWDVPAGTVTWTPELRRILGVSDEMPSSAQTFLDMIHPEDKPWAERSMRESLKTGIAHEVPFRIVRPDGCVRVIQGRTITTRFEDGKPVYMVGVLQDLGGEKDCAVAVQERRALESLSERERQVLERVARGDTSRLVAQALNLSPKTVDTYRSRIAVKLGVADFAALIRFCTRHGIAVQ